MTDFVAIFRDNHLSLLFKWSPNLCTRVVSLMRFPDPSSSGVFRKLAVGSVRVSCDAKKQLIDRHFSLNQVSLLYRTQQTTTTD